MKTIRAAIVGYGNIGKYTLEALQASEDFEIAGIVRRHGAEDKPAELAQYKVVKDITELGDVDVAILATPSRSCEEYAKKIVALGINTVDSFDIHTDIADYRNRMMLEEEKESMAKEGSRAMQVKEIEKAIMASDLGINPTNDGKLIRLVFPELTEERRKELAKDIKKKGENAKVAVRNIRRDAMDHFKKIGKEEDISEDQIKDLEDGIQKLTDQYVAKIDKAVEVKSQEILTV